LVARRRKGLDVRLPPNVNKVASKGKVYFYYQPGRGTDSAAASVPLGSDPTQVWERWRAATAAPAPAVAPGKTFKDMVEAWKTSNEWVKGYSAATQRDYTFYVDKMTLAWGKLAADAVAPAAVLTARDAMADSSGSANHMLAVGKALYRWAVPRGFSKTNPFREVSPLPRDDEGHRPWPDWAIDYVMQHAWEDLRRFVFLAVEIGQRESDVVRIGPEMREGRGLWVRPQKTRRRRKAFFCPLTTAAIAELDRWAKEPMTFISGRWGREILVQPGDTYVLSPAGNPYTPEGLRSRWNRWLATDTGKAFLARWRPWEAAQRARYGEDVGDPEDFAPTLHGLRSTAVCRRKLAGYTNNQISNDIGMSLAMVERYARFIDQKAAAETNIIVLDAVDRRRGNAL